MVKISIAIVFLLLMVSCSIGSASVQYPLASVDSQDKVRVNSVTDTRFMAANNNAISSIELLVTVDQSPVTVNLTNPDSVAVYTITKTKTGYFNYLLEYNLKIYENGGLVSNESSSRTLQAVFGGTNWESVTIDDGMIYARNLSAVSMLIPSHEITVSTSSSTRVDLTVVNVNELAAIAIQNDLNWLFALLYSLLSFVYDDPDNGLLSFLYLFSYLMDATLLVLWLSFTNTYLVIVWIEGLITFYAGWRNNKMKGFMDDMLSWHQAVAVFVLKAAKQYFEIVHDIIKSIVPGYG